MVSADPLDVVIMAAGKGTRMKSERPKVLHRLGGRALLGHVLDTAVQLSARQAVVIVGHQAEVVRACVGSLGLEGLQPVFALQQPQLGTGHAVQQALPFLQDDGTTLVLSGDVPLTRPETLRDLLALGQGQKLALLTLQLPDPTGYGRVLRQGSAVQAIVEHKDATAQQRCITEVYSGIMALPTRLLRQWLGRLDQRNAQQEYYLTDIVRFAVADGAPVVAHCIDKASEVAGVNSPAQLAELERIFQREQAERLMAEGVRLADPGRFDLRGQLLCGPDVEIDVGCVFEGRVELGAGVRVGAHCVIAQASIADGTIIAPFTHIDGEAAGVEVGEDARIGPFTRLRPGTRLARQVHIGNFVEVKNATLAEGTKANHLAYLGDASVGARVNYGAGSITANYDGANKHRTVIEDDVHVGSNCVLVAPVTLGAGGTIGGGSTITEDTPPGALTVARGKQMSVANWQRPQKKR